MIETPDLVSALLIFLAITLSAIIARKTYKRYRENRDVLMLIISIASVFIVLAMSLLMLEQVFLMEEFKDAFLAIYVFGGAATTISGFAVVSFDLFAIKMVFPKRVVILTTIAAIAVLIYVVFWWLNPKEAPGSEIEFLNFPGLGFPLVEILNYLILIPLFSLPIFILLYYTIKVRNESPIASKRSALLGLGGLALATAYTIELLGLGPWVTTGFRSLFVLAMILFYIGLFKIKKEE